MSTISVKVLHLKAGAPGMVHVRIGDADFGTNTALEPEEAFRIASALMAAATVALEIQGMSDDLAAATVGRFGEVSA